MGPDNPRTGGDPECAKLLATRGDARCSIDGSGGAPVVDNDVCPLQRLAGSARVVDANPAAGGAMPTTPAQRRDAAQHQMPLGRAVRAAALVRITTWTPPSRMPPVWRDPRDAPTPLEADGCHS